MKKINGLAVFEYGTENDQSIVFVHGFPFDHNMWEEVCETLSAEYHVVSYDVRGLGESEVGDGNYTMEQYVDDLNAIILHTELHEPVLCGLSMGGYIVQRYTEKYTNLSGVILCNTKSNADSDEAKQNRIAGMDKIDRYGLRAFVEDFISGTLHPDNRESGLYLNKLVNRAAGYNPEGVKGAMKALMSRTDTTANLSKIPVPSLVICGEGDTLATPEAMYEMWESIPDSEYYVLPDAGHLTPIENPYKFIEAVEDYLYRLYSYA